MSSDVKRQPWQGEPLPRGRHRLAPEQVRASQRERLLRAMVESVAERGYEATTVPHVVSLARASRNAFYEFFADKTECFLAACDESATETLTQLLALAAEPDWIHAMRRGTAVYLHRWQERPAFARAYFLGMPVAGERGAQHRERIYAGFRAMFADLGRRARAEQPDLPPLPDVVPRVLVLAITELVAEEIRAGRLDRLTDLEADILYLCVKLLSDDTTAAQAVQVRSAA
jgi:AcrR family transcriptional regulator